MKPCPCSVSLAARAGSFREREKPAGACEVEASPSS